MARFEATTAIVAVLAGAGALAAASCSGPEAFQHSGTSSFLGGSGGRGTTAGLGGAGGGGGDGEGAIAGAAGLTGAGGDDMGAPGGGPGDSGGAAGETPGGAAGGAPLGGGGVAEGGHPAAAGGAAGGESIGAAGAGGFGGGRAMGAGGLAGAGAGGRVASGGRSGTGGAAGSGAGGAAGLGGAGGVTPPCGTCTLTIQCRNYAPADTTSMNTELWILNTGDQPIPLGMIRVRYYYTNEGGPMALEIFDKAFKRTDGSGYLSVTASFSMTIGKLTKPAMDFSDIAVTGSTVLDKSVPFYFKMAIHDLNHSRLTLTNDYSNAPVAIGPCPTIVALVGNAVAGGVPPR